MIESAANLGFHLYLIVTCLFAPIDSDKFTLDVYENSKLVRSFPVNRTEDGFTIYANKEEKIILAVIALKDEVYSIEANGKTHSIDNNKLKIKPLKSEGNFKKKIQSSEITFEFTKGDLKVFQEGNDKLFIIKK